MLGFDITWSTPKSVSALYAQGTEQDRSAIDDSIEAAVTAGTGYIEREGFRVRRNGRPETASKMIAASYRHNTNRALEPQLHEHVVIVNMATNRLGQTRAVDARGLSAHATTAGYLAGAELRTQLAQRLGVEWATPHKGLADFEGVDRATIMAISSRRQAVLTLADELGYFTLHMLAIEQRVIERHREGIDRGCALVKPHAVKRAINDSPISLGADQAAMIRANHHIGRPVPSRHGTLWRWHRAQHPRCDAPRVQTRRPLWCREDQPGARC